MLLVVLTFLVQVVAALVSVAFFTLLERKVLGYIQLRKGPNKPGFVGVPSPLADAVKLAVKEIRVPVNSNLSFFYLSPVLGLFLALLFWCLIVSYFGIMSFILSVMFFLAVSRLSVYRTVVAGWASNSKYALLGSLRAVAQTISYEVRIALILVGGVLVLKSMDLCVMELNQTYV